MQTYAAIDLHSNNGVLAIIGRGFNWAGACVFDVEVWDGAPSFTESPAAVAPNDCAKWGLMTTIEIPIVHTGQIYVTVQPDWGIRRGFVSIDNLKYQAPSAHIYGEFTPDGPGAVQLAPLTLPSSTSQPATVMTAPNAAAQTINVPLGLPFAWRMLSADKAPVPATYTLLAFTPAPDYPIVDDSATYPGRTVCLFKDGALLAFGDPGIKQSQAFLAIHLGTQYFSVTPQDSSIPNVTVKVNVLPPTKLGKQVHEVDDDILRAANRRGIPPQWIKGQVSIEAEVVSNEFDRETYRYEPLSADYSYVSRDTDGSGYVDRVFAPCPGIGLPQQRTMAISRKERQWTRPILLTAT